MTHFSLCALEVSLLKIYGNNNHHRGLIAWATAALAQGINAGAIPTNPDAIGTKPGAIGSVPYQSLQPLTGARIGLLDAQR